MNSLLKKEFYGIVRSLKISENQDVMCVEEIEPNELIPRYHIVDLSSMKVTSEDILVKKSKQLVVKGVTHDQLILIEYDQGKNPDHSKVIAYNYLNKEVTWEKVNIKILEISGDVVKTLHPYFENKFSYWNVSTGIECEDMGTDSSPIIKLENFPIFYTSESEYFQWFEKFILEHTKDVAILCCEYLEHNSGMIISYYVSKNQKIENNLLVINNEGQIKELINIGKNLQGIGKDTFFTMNSKLIFISHKNTLNVYEI